MTAVSDFITLLSVTSVKVDPHGVVIFLLL